ncbi:F0F1 ATP synthase subunit delta [Rossellomorea vietnamensis]|uniref:F0F1 ATP synthase subunit delta n=1 Tax=Rossellomorea vietnamensis TaxID=218284 RepID=UPI003CF02B30
MSNIAVAKRYAIALFKIAKEHNQLESVEVELRIVKTVFEENKELGILLQSPRISVEKKKDIVKEAFSSASLYVMNTLMLLLDRHRASEVTALVDAYIELANDERGIAEAKVYSVRPLDEAEKAALSASFAKKVGKSSLRIENITDPSILGGLKLRIGNRIFDGSLKGKLERLERELIRN